MRSFNTFSVVAMVCGLFLAVTPAAADFINFASDTAGAKPNGWMSVDSSLVSFTDSVGTGLSVGDFGVQSNGQALAVFDDFDDSQLVMDFTAVMNAISLDFGNDDPSFSNPGDPAVLTVFLGGVQVGQTSVIMNRNDLMDQSISVVGVNFDRATFKYVVPPTQGLIEIVDNIQVLIPEPGTLAMLALGGILVMRRRR